MDSSEAEQDGWTLYEVVTSDEDIMGTVWLKEAAADEEFTVKATFEGHRAPGLRRHAGFH